ncbi:replication initiator protein A [Bacillus sp. JJ634]
MGKFFTDDDMDSLVFFQVPKVLVLGETYKKMKPNALKLYMVLLDRMKLSIQNGWKNEEGRYYVRMSQEGAAELFGWSPTTFRSMKKELEDFGLLIQDREGQGKSNRLYILKCEYDESDIYVINKSVDMEMEENEKVAQTIDNTKKNKSCSSRKTEVDLLEEQLLTPNNNNFSKNNLNKKNNLVNKHSFGNNSFHESSTHFSEEETIFKLTNEYRQKGLSKEVCLRVVKEAREKQGVKNFGGYLRTCLEGTLHRSLIKRGIINPAEEMKKIAEENGSSFYDWLEDEQPF